ncbi:MAG: NnrU family protein [Hyphomicrobiales bacterium]|nr:NnrU family protein [Hyphomicrobiales bacterium]MBW0005381.1 NnrU family protein [Hyphomicrobiales bacterium]
MELSTLIIGLVLFLGGHAFTMHRAARARLLESLGEGRYRGLYSIVSLAGLVLIIRGYGVYRSAGMVPLWYPPAFLRHVTFLLLLIAFILIAATYPPSHIKRWVRHPMITAIILWSFGHLLVRGDLGSVLMFGGFLLWGILARISMARRALKDVPGPTAVLTEPRWQSDLAVVAVGLVAYFAFVIWGHPWLIGVSVV